MGNRTLRLSASMIAAIAGTAAAQPCTPSWSAMGAGQNQPVNGLVMHDDGGGMDLYAGGTFSGTAGNRVARWDGAAWSTLGTGLNNGVISLLSFNDGTGPALYVGGVFLMAGGAPATRVAKWDGNAWSALGAGLSSNVASLCVYNDGNGPAIYAGGVFVMSGTTSVNRIAKWNGTDWLPLGNGVDGTIQQLLAHDDGSGSALYACGFFTLADSVPGTAYLARWNGLTWSPVSTELPIDGVVRAIGEFDDGTGNALYAAIDWYAIPTGVPVSRVAKWDGAAWSDVGPAPAAGLMNGSIVDFAVFDDGTGGGPALYAAGTFTTIAGISANRIAKWDGSVWSPLSSGITGGGQVINALASWDFGQGPTLFAGGGFTTAGGVPATRIAQWRGCLPVCYANCDNSTTAPVLNVQDFSCFLNQFASGDTYANCDLSTTDPVLNVQDFSCFLNAFAAGCT